MLPLLFLLLTAELRLEASPLLFQALTFLCTETYTTCLRFAFALLLLFALCSHLPIPRNVTTSPSPATSPSLIAYPVSKLVPRRACAHKQARADERRLPSCRRAGSEPSRSSDLPLPWHHSHSVSRSQSWPFLLCLIEQVFLSLLSLLRFIISSCLFFPLLVF